MIMLSILSGTAAYAKTPRAADLGIRIGILKSGEHNAITDVPGVRVGHVTVVRGDSVRTGATAIIPHSDNIFQNKVPAAIHLGNAFGKLTGYPQVEELGNIETPVILTNTLSVPRAAEALIDYTFRFPANRNVRSVNPVVGETNDGGLNDIRRRVLTRKDILQAIDNASGGPVEEGNIGAGTGTICFGFKGGIGTASRVLPESRGGYTVGVLVQSNYGGILQIAGVPVGIELEQYSFRSVEEKYSADGSCMIVVMTDAPLCPRNLKRLAKRAMFGLARTGGIASNGSGDFVIAASTAEDLRIPYSSGSALNDLSVLRNSRLSLLFEAVIEATEEAIVNSLFAAEGMTGYRGRKVEALPVDKTLKILRQYKRIK
ncbi:MAG: P1 family peptidase [Candidatus Marinimicrobia bacterium]|nr:P1 family peptidase [Candidatus Neomarinimicrobiota bacterium]